MQFNSKNNHMVDLIFTLALFAVFAVSILVVVYFGSEVYKNTAENMETTFSSRTALTFVTKQIRQNNIEDGIYISEIEGVEALAMEETIEEVAYIKYIYLNDGYLCEVFTRKDLVPSLMAGQKLIEIKEFDMEQISDNLYEFSVVGNDGKSSAMTISVE